MDYAQERITTLHDLADYTPVVPVGDAAVVVPLAGREAGSLAAERTFEALESVAPGRVVVPVSAGGERIGDIDTWLEGYDLDLDLLWCGGEELLGLLDDHGLNGAAGKGRDLWLALGVAATEHDYLVCHDADRRTYTAADVPCLLAPLVSGYGFTKGYYARVENGRLYGRLWRLLYVPLVRALADRHDARVLRYLGAFRYALAGEFGLTADLARSLRFEPRFGLEVGTLGGAFDRAGFDGTAQVDLGRYEHDHRAVRGPAGLAAMAEDVAGALFRVVEAHAVAPDYGTIAERYQTVAHTLLEQYAADAAHNGFEYDRREERAQVEAYADAIQPPGEDDRLPPWQEAPIEPAAVREAVAADLDGG